MRGLESLSIFALKHHLKLLPFCALVISFFGIDVGGFQVAKIPDIEDFPVLQLMGKLKLNLQASQWIVAILLAEGILGKQGETNLSEWGLV